jgi:hypothetical protein
MAFQAASARLPANVKMVLDHNFLTNAITVAQAVRNSEDSMNVWDEISGNLEFDAADFHYADYERKAEKEK